MSIEKVKSAPSLQHLVRMIDVTSAKTAKRMLEPKPKIRTYEANHYIRSMLSGMAPEKVMAAAEADRRENIRKTTLEVLPLTKQYLEDFDTGWFKRIPPILHQVSPSIRIPIKPLGIMRVEDQVVVIWPQLWKTLSLTPEQFNIFASYMKYGILDKFPDYNNFHWLEMSVPKGRKQRELRVRTIETAQLLSKAQLLEVEKNLELALQIVEANQTSEPRKPQRDPEQGDLF